MCAHRNYIDSGCFLQNLDYISELIYHMKAVLHIFLNCTLSDDSVHFDQQGHSPRQRSRFARPGCSCFMHTARAGLAEICSIQYAILSPLLPLLNISSSTTVFACSSLNLAPLMQHLPNNSSDAKVLFDSSHMQHWGLTTRFRPSSVPSHHSFAAIVVRARG